MFNTPGKARRYIDPLHRCAKLPVHREQVQLGQPAIPGKVVRNKRMWSMRTTKRAAAVPATAFLSPLSQDWLKPLFLIVD